MNKKPSIVTPPIPPKDVGARIRRARKTYDWSLDDLSRISGIKRGTLACYECGTRLPIRDNLVKLAISLRRTLDFLILGRHDRRGKDKRGQSHGGAPGRLCAGPATGVPAAACDLSSRTRKRCGE